MRETSHDNLARFIGICTENGVAIVSEFCSKGSLRSLLANCSINLDWIFRCSIINDIISGMCYLHNSEHIYHGRLNSNNCLIDSRFCVKISDFGLRKLKNEAGCFYCCHSFENNLKKNSAIDTDNNDTSNSNHNNSNSNVYLKLPRKCQISYLADQNDENLLYYAPEFFFPYKCKNSDAYCLCTNFGSEKGDVYRQERQILIKTKLVNFFLVIVLQSFYKKLS